MPTKILSREVWRFSEKNTVASDVAVTNQNSPTLFPHIRILVK